jgi:hypothetical protein
MEIGHAEVKSFSVSYQKIFFSFSFSCCPNKASSGGPLWVVGFYWVGPKIILGYWGVIDICAHPQCVLCGNEIVWFMAFLGPS